VIGPALALLPFTVLETLGLKARYERSFKLSPGSLLAQRYLLGVPVSSQSRGLMVEAARRMGMPAAAQTRFERALEGASTALYGCEAGPDGVVLKAYAEYRARLERSLAAARSTGATPSPVEMFVGFKWRGDAQPALRAAQTHYTGHPALGATDVLSAVNARLSGERNAAVRRAVQAVLGQAFGARQARSPLWLDVGEVEAPTRAFDLNLYDAELSVDDVAAALTDLASAFGIAPALWQRLLRAAGPGMLGHVSAGQSRQATPYLTVYFEP
jgi:hypothetical protein